MLTVKRQLAQLLMVDQLVLVFPSRAAKSQNFLPLCGLAFPGSNLGYKSAFDDWRRDASAGQQRPIWLYYYVGFEVGLGGVGRNH